MPYTRMSAFIGAHYIGEVDVDYYIQEKVGDIVPRGAWDYIKKGLNLLFRWHLSIRYVSLTFPTHVFKITPPSSYNIAQVDAGPGAILNGTLDTPHRLGVVDEVVSGKIMELLREGLDPAHDVLEHLPGEEGHDTGASPSSQ